MATGHSLSPHVPRICYGGVGDPSPSRTPGLCLGLCLIFFPCEARSIILYLICFWETCRSCLFRRSYSRSAYRSRPRRYVAFINYWTWIIYWTAHRGHCEYINLRCLCRCILHKGISQRFRLWWHTILRQVIRVTSGYAFFFSFWISSYFSTLGIVFFKSYIHFAIFIFRVNGALCQV